MTLLQIKLPRISVTSKFTDQAKMGIIMIYKACIENITKDPSPTGGASPVLQQTMVEGVRSPGPP